MVWSQLSIYRLVAKSRDELVSAIPCIDWSQSPGMNWSQPFSYGLVSAIQLWTGLSHSVMDWSQPFSYGLVSAIPCIDWVQQSRYKLGKVLSIVSYLHLLDLCGLVMK